MKLILCRLTWRYSSILKLSSRARQTVRDISVHMYQSRVFVSCGVCEWGWMLMCVYICMYEIVQSFVLRTAMYAKRKWLEQKFGKLIVGVQVWKGVRCTYYIVWKFKKKVRIPRELANSSIMTFLDPLNVCLVLFFFQFLHWLFEVLLV